MTPVSTSGNFIEAITWDVIAGRIAGGAAAILPIGAGSKEHGFHLPMNTDKVQAEWFAARLAAEVDALIWPTVTYGHYPAFADYAGSSSLSAATFESVISEVVAGIAAFGCRPIFLVNTGISTLAPVERALARVDAPTVHLQLYRGTRYRQAADRLAEQSHGGHADELETSLMLAIAPDLVAMTRAEASQPLTQETSGPLTLHDPASPNFSRSGSFGNPTLATREKGDILLVAMVEDIMEQVRTALAVTAIRDPASDRSAAERQRASQ